MSGLHDYSCRQRWTGGLAIQYHHGRKSNLDYLVYRPFIFYSSMGINGGWRQQNHIHCTRFMCTFILYAVDRLMSAKGTLKMSLGFEAIIEEPNYLKLTLN